MFICCGHSPAVEPSHTVVVDECPQHRFHGGAPPLDQPSVVRFIVRQLLMHPVIKRFVDTVIQLLEIAFSDTDAP